MGARVILWTLVLIVFVALYADLILKASNDLRGYRPDGPRLSAPSDLKLHHAPEDNRG